MPQDQLKSLNSETYALNPPEAMLKVKVVWLYFWVARSLKIKSKLQTVSTLRQIITAA